MGAEIVERADVPEIIERNGLFYFTAHGKDLRAYRPADMLLLQSRINSAVRLWGQSKRVAEVVPIKRRKRGH